MTDPYKLIEVNWELVNKKGIRKTTFTKLINWNPNEIIRSDKNVEIIRESLRKCRTFKLIKDVDLRSVTINNFRQVIEGFKAQLDTKVYVEEDYMTSDLDYIKIMKPVSEKKEQTDQKTTVSNKSEIVSTPISEGEENTRSKNNSGQSGFSIESVQKITDTKNTIETVVNSEEIKKSEMGDSKAAEKKEKFIKSIGMYSAVETSSTFKKFLDQFEAKAKIFAVTEDADKLECLKVCLADHDVKNIIEMGDNKNKDYAAITKLVEVLIDGKCESQWPFYAQQMSQLKADKFESLTKFMCEFARLKSKLGTEVSEKLQLEHFCSALPNSVENYVRARDPSDVMAAYDYASKIYRDKRSYNVSAAQSSSNRAGFRGGFRGRGQNSRGRGNGQNRTFRGRGGNRGFGNRGSFQGQRGRGQNRGRFPNKRNIQCYACGKFGHYQAECREGYRISQASYETTEQNDAGNQYEDNYSSIDIKNNNFKNCSSEKLKFQPHYQNYAYRGIIHKNEKTPQIVENHQINQNDAYRGKIQKHLKTPQKLENPQIRENDASRGKIQKSQSMSENYHHRILNQPFVHKNRFEVLSNHFEAPSSNTVEVKQTHEHKTSLPLFQKTRKNESEKREKKRENLKNRNDSNIERTENNFEDFKISHASFEDSSGVKVVTQLGCAGVRKGIQWTPTVDTAATKCVLDVETAKEIGCEIDTSRKIRIILADNSVSKNVVGIGKSIFMKIPGCDKEFYFEPLIVDVPKKVSLLGLDLLKTAEGGHFYLKKDGSMAFRFNILDTACYNYKIHAAEAITIPPNSSAVCPISDPGIKTIKNDRIMIKPICKEKPYKTPFGLLDPDKKQALLVNSTGKPIQICKGEIIANAEIVEDVQKSESMTKPEINSVIWRKFVATVDSKISHIKNPTQRWKAKQMLLRRWKCFDEGCGNPLGKVNDIILRINPDDKEIVVPLQKRRPYNPNVWSRVKQELEEHEKLGIIEDCIAPKSSPANIVVVKRKGKLKKGNEKLRVCIDYVDLNKFLPDNFTPLPTTTDMLDLLADSDENSYYCKMDVSSCYHNFVLDERDRDLTAFYTDKGVKRYARLPFGLKNAPGLVQKYMSGVIASVQLNLSPGALCGVYLDDGLVHSKGFDNCINDFELVLKAFEGKNMRLKLSKMEIAKKEVEFMGISCKADKKGANLEVVDESKEALKLLSQPKNLKDLRGFLGCFAWLSQFLPKINLKLAPFHELLKKLLPRKNCAKPPKLTDLWTEDHSRYFKELIETVPQCLQQGRNVLHPMHPLHPMKL